MLIRLDASSDQGLSFVREQLKGQVTTWVAMPYTDGEMAHKAGKLIQARAGDAKTCVLLLEDVARDGFISVANKAFEHCSAPFFAYVAQDAFPGRNWLHRALERLQTENAGLCGLNDGKWAGALAAFGVVRTAWARSVYETGTLFYPEYNRHYADLELTQIAKAAGQYCYEPDAVMMEIDWQKDNKSTDRTDFMLYQARQKSLDL